MRRVRRSCEHVFQPLRLAFHPSPLKRRIPSIHVRLDRGDDIPGYRSATYVWYEQILRSDEGYLRDAPFSPPADTPK